MKKERMTSTIELPSGRRDGCALQFAPEELKGDRELALEAAPSPLLFLPPSCSLHPSFLPPSSLLLPSSLLSPSFSLLPPLPALLAPLY